MAPDGADGACPEDQEGIAAAAGVLVDYMEDVDEDGSSAAADGSNNHLDIYDEVENFYLQRGASAVSIMRLPLCIEDEVVSDGDESAREIYLVGQSVSKSREIRYLAEKWMLDLHPNIPPTFLVKAACGWIRVQKPKVVYRRIMTDGLTLAHFLHYVRDNPSGSASIAREHLANEFRHFGEKPSLEKLSDFFPVIRRYIKVDMKMENPSILRDFFPGHFSDVVASCTAREIKERACEGERSFANGCAIEPDEEIKNEVKHTEKQEVKITLKTVKAHRASVQAELRNLHSQWCSLIGGRAAVKAEKRPAANKCRTSERKNPASGKPERPKSASRKSETGNDPLSKESESQNTVPKKGRPSVADRKKAQAKRHRGYRCNSPVPKKGCPSEPNRRGRTSSPSVECKTSTLDQQEKPRPSPKLPNSQDLSEEKTMNLKRRKGAQIKSALSFDSENTAPPSRMVVGTTTDLFDRLEDPPICTICDDGGDLICCEGPCQRHFHATPGGDTSCKTLGLTPAQVKKTDIYYCKNCLLKRHQCFICHELGSSDPSLGPQEVYICDAPGCRKFYHAGCVAKVLEAAIDWKALADRIERGLHGFLCPRHSCAVCTSKELQPGIFVQCRRCPKAWHRDCLTDFAFSGELPATSIWKHYDREFIYCKEHKILPHILTPAQDHVRFPKE